MARQREAREIPAEPVRTLWVSLDWQGTPRVVGRLHGRVEGDREWAEFEPHRTWTRRPEAAICAPMLAAFPGSQLTLASMPLYGAIGDSAPDRWGRSLMRRYERRMAHKEGREPRVLREVDYLLGVDDEIRVGALRFAKRRGGPFLGGKQGTTLPRVRALPRLADAVRAHEENRDTLAQARLLLIAGQLLGGSRPKASIRGDDGTLYVAKFPSHGDDRDMQRWEALVLALAIDCGIEVPGFAVAGVEQERILLLARFDREDDGHRIPFVSAYGLVGAQDNEAGSFRSLAEMVRRHGARPREDLVQLWRRALFALMISDKDNHLRNHGMLLREEGWRLCPAFDLNAEPEPLKPREMLLGIDGVDNTASLEVALAAAPHFDVPLRDARAIAREIAEVVRTWRERAKAWRLPRKEIDKMAPAFEHAELHRALKLGATVPQRAGRKRRRKFST